MYATVIAIEAPRARLIRAERTWGAKLLCQYTIGDRYDINQFRGLLHTTTDWGEMDYLCGLYVLTIVDQIYSRLKVAR